MNRNRDVRRVQISGWCLVLMALAPGWSARGVDLPQLRVAGTHVVDDRGERVRLRGVNAASLEWTSNGEGHIRETVRVAVRDWRCNVVRIPLAQDRWFGRAPEQTDEGVAYRALVREVVDDCVGLGAYAMLDLHWSDAGEWGHAIGQHVMPDRNSVAFWRECAAAYANRPGVIFDLYNEPHDVSWDVWLRGGPVTETDGKTGAKTTFEAVGMQALLDAVRATGARNLAVVGGLDWSYDLSGILDGRQLTDPTGRGVIYANHAYPFKGDTVARWVGKMERATKTLPVIVGEFGSDPGGGRGLTGEEWVRSVLGALKAHDWDWIAWDLHPGAGPSLIRGWDYAPTTHFGAAVKEALRPEEAATPAPPATPVGVFDGSGDIGAVGVAGSTTFDPATRRYTVGGSGANMWFGTDAGRFAWKRVSTDTIRLVASIAFEGAGKNPHRKAALMIRQSLAPDSPQVSAVIHGDGLTSLQFRDAPGANTHEIRSNVKGEGTVVLNWRDGYATMDVGSFERGVGFSGSTRISFAQPFYVGIAICSHEDDTLERATFTHLNLNEGGPNPPRRGPIPYSTLETMTLASTDRQIVRVFPGRIEPAGGAIRGRIEAPNWTKDGAELIYNGDGRLHRIAATGGEPTVIDTGSATRCNNDHGISPDGSTLAISDGSGPDRKSRISLVPLAGGTPRVVTPTAPSYWHGWSPDGRTLAFCGERDGAFDVYTIPASGGAETRLTTAEGLDDGPEYSPDGRTIFFNSDRSGLMQVYRMDPDGSNQRPVFTDERNNWFAHPSPDGSRLVYVSFEKEVKGHPEDKDVELRLLTLATGKVETLARLRGGQGTINVPSWSPDGKRIAFVSYHLDPR